MLLLDDLPMANGRGRPARSPDEPDDRQVRVFKDLADMIGWIHFFERKAGRKVSIAQLLDPLLRKQVTKLYEPYAALVESILAKKGEGQSGKGKKHPEN